MNERKPPWFLLTGLLIGLGLGLLCAWVVCPRHQTGGTPRELRADFKEYYRALVARAYAYNHNLPRARARLELLGEPSTALAEALRAQAQRALAEGHPQSEVNALGALAAALGEEPPPATAVAAATQTPTPHPTATPTPKQTTNPTATPSPQSTAFPTLPPTPTPLPTVTPRPTVNTGLFLLRSEKLLCDPKKGPLLEIWAENPSGKGIPGVEIEIHWLGGNESIYTGLKPEISPGYADFLMKPKVLYQVRIGTGTTVSKLSPMECQTKDGQRYWGGWKLLFIKR